MSKITDIVSNIKNLGKGDVDTTAALKKRGGLTAGVIGGLIGLGIGHSRKYNLLISAAAGAVIASVVYHYTINKD